MIYPREGQSPEQIGKDRYDLGGAARGAAAGAAIGAIGGDAGKGAAIGATAGGMKRGFENIDSRRAA